MKQFTIFWIGGNSEIINGNSFIEAFKLAGYGGGAISAVDFYTEGNKKDNYKYLKSEKRWASIIDPKHIEF